MELGVGTLFSTSAGSVSGAGVGDVLVDDSRDGALREGSKPWAADKRTIGLPCPRVETPRTEMKRRKVWGDKGRTEWRTTQPSTPLSDS